MATVSRPAAPQRRGARIAWGLMALAAVGTGLFSVLPYLTFNPGASRLPLNPAFPWHMTGLSLHAIPGGLALLLGPVQFVPAIQRRYPAVHRTVGGIYLISIVVGSVMGVYAAIVSVSGLTAQLGFLLLAATWFYSGLRAFLAIRRRQIQLHRIWMIRNYALTFAAVLLRVFLAAGIAYRQTDPSLDFGAIYTSSVWCSIFVSYIAAEWFIVQRTFSALLLQDRPEAGPPLARRDRPRGSPAMRTGGAAPTA